MKMNLRIGLSAMVGSALLASTVSATTVNYKQIRSMADTLNEGFVWSIASDGPPNHPTCLSAGKSTVHGAAYAGALNSGGFPSGRREDVISDMSAVVIFDATDLQAAAVTGNYKLHLSNTQNFGFGAILQVSVVPDDVVRNLLQGGNADGSGAPAPRGPFPAGFTRIFDAAMASNGGQVAESHPIPFLPAITSQDITLSDGAGGVLNACLGPTGQVRFIDPGNNGDWATECVANGWRSAQIPVGAKSKFSDAVTAAMSNAAITTCRFSCSPPTTPQRDVDCTATIAHPLAIALTAIHGSDEMNRGEEYLWTTLALGGDNLIVLANDSTSAADLWIDAF
jgi:hypothetical protein